MASKPVRIAGAGISGLASALFLSKSGASVHVYEKNKCVGKRFSGSFQCIPNFIQQDGFSTLDALGVKKNFWSKPIHDVTVIGPDKTPHALHSREPIWTVVKRGEEADSLDSGLFTQAKDAGARFHFGSSLPPAQSDILATGGRQVDGVAKEFVFDTDSPDCATLILDDNIAPKGYAYLFVHDGRATVCIALMRDFPRIDAYFQKAKNVLLEDFGYSVRNPHEKGNFVSFYLAGSAKNSGSLLVGEAAGFQDFLFGFGLRFAFVSSSLASKSIIERADYDSLWKNSFGPLLEVGVFNRWAFELLGNTGYSFFVSEAEKAKDFRTYLSKWYGPGAFKRLAIPLIKFLNRRRSICNHGICCNWCNKKQ